MGNFIDMTGRKYGRLTVIERADDVVYPKGQRSTRWECRCDCGNTKIVTGSSLRKGEIVSCGCYQLEVAINKIRGQRRPVLGEPDPYKAIHGRLNYWLGKAANRLCVDCGNPAEEWSFNLDRVEAAGFGDLGQPYSLKFEDYVPRCRKCHRRLDFSRKRES